MGRPKRIARNDDQCQWCLEIVDKKTLEEVEVVYARVDDNGIPKRFIEIERVCPKCLG